MKPHAKKGTDISISSHKGKTPKRPKAEQPAAGRITTQDIKQRRGK